MMILFTNNSRGSSFSFGTLINDGKSDIDIACIFPIPTGISVERIVENLHPLIVNLCDPMILISRTTKRQLNLCRKFTVF